MRTVGIFRPFFLIVKLFFISINLTAQVKDYNSLPSGLSRSQNLELENTVTTEKNYWLPVVEIVGLNFAVWGYHRYLSGENWSDINWETIKYNLKYGFVWDDDGYLTNQFWHPFHGANYYNAARSNGLGILGICALYFFRKPDVGIFYGKSTTIL